MLINELYNNLNIFYNQNWNKFRLINPLFIIDNSSNSLTWANYKSKESFDTYEEYFYWTLDNNQYSLMIDELGLVQIFYHFKNNSVNNSSLSYLPNPEITSEYFRFDLDERGINDFSHTFYHFQFSYPFNNFRIPIKSFPYPSEFLNYILFLLGLKELKNFNKNNSFEDLDSLQLKNRLNENKGFLYNHCIDFLH